MHASDVCVSVWLHAELLHAELFLKVFRTAWGWFGSGSETIGMSLTHNAHIVVILDTTYVDVSCRLV